MIVKHQYNLKLCPSFILMLAIPNASQQYL